MKYDGTGNRSKLDYYLSGSLNGHKASVNYTYNSDNLLTGFTTSGSGGAAPTFSFDAAGPGDIDGLGRLADANETLTNTSGNPVAHKLNFAYDSLSQLTSANISNIGPDSWTGDYNYQKNGDMDARTINSGASESFSYVGNEMRTIDGNSLDYDLNGNLISDEAQDANYVYNWDNKLRSATIGSDSISLKYDPAGNRVRKNSTINGNRKYIVDIVGELPVILLEIDPANMSVKKGYIYANSQILAEHDGDYTASRYFYLHDRLGSVRQMINQNGAVVVLYTYNPFGETLEEQGTVSNDFKFTGQWCDSETGQYYLRNRQYIPYITRFASADPVLGEIARPLSLHKYLYCENDPINGIDPTGLWTFYATLTGMGAFGIAGMGQFGIVIDDNGNVGGITTLGYGGGTPVVGGGVSFGWTNADTMYDLRGKGWAFGGSWLRGGLEYIRGYQQSGELYEGVEVTLGNMWTPPICFGLEGHGYRTYTKVVDLGINWKDAIGLIEESLEEGIYESKTLGEAYGYFGASSMFENLRAFGAN